MALSTLKIKNRFNNKGQAGLEALVAGSGLILFFSFCLALIYLGTIHTHLRYMSHEYLLCPEYQSKFLCTQKLEKALKETVRFGQIQNLKTVESFSQRKVSFQYSLNILRLRNIHMTYLDQIKLPISKD